GAKVEVAVLVELEEVAGAAPVAVEGAPALVAVLEVAERDGVALHPHHAGLARRELGLSRGGGVGGEDLERVAVDHAAERAGLDVAGTVGAVDVEHLGRADAVVDVAAEALAEADGQRGRERLAGGEVEAHAGEVEPGLAR